ncbi:hypothetical protein SeMB42_g04403 [Synchytrium endobioticum]|uniref:Uncharacterized protein n=1 Tax=Synchytrium endobioticum TaxID=286115 RepID=A0A507CYL0_9FUNG|nr:hypothetical protein SeLEV6574_g05706 [Synchytrium endobioticum]TPX44262.1 hypothetical protein SeMB42_g04403 [Synchytrium endobioticum]
MTKENVPPCSEQQKHPSTDTVPNALSIANVQSLLSSLESMDIDTLDFGQLLTQMDSASRALDALESKTNHLMSRLDEFLMEAEETEAATTKSNSYITTKQ